MVGEGRLVTVTVGEGRLVTVTVGEGRLVAVTVGEGRLVTVTVTCVRLLKPIFSLLPLTGKALVEIKVRALLTVDTMLFHMDIFCCMASLVPPPLDHSGLFVST